MENSVYKTSNDIGRSPDDIYFRGQKKQEQTIVRLFEFSGDNQKEETLSEINNSFNLSDKGCITWINIDGLSNIELLESIAQIFNFEKQVIAEVMNTYARPRVVEFENCIFLSVRMLQEKSKNKSFRVENISFVITPDVLISFQEVKGDVFDPIRERIRKQKKKIINGGTDYLCYALLDIIIDNYLLVLTNLGEQIESLEDKILQDPNEKVINNINRYKRQLNFLRKNVKPAREMINSLLKVDNELFTKKSITHIKSLLENMNQASDVSDNYRDILSDQLNIYHTILSSKLNDIMKFLTVFSVIFIPLTFIAGIYGTNFEYIPELSFKYSYLMMWIIMIVITITMLIYFKRKKWL